MFCNITAKKLNKTSIDKLVHSVDNNVLIRPTPQEIKSLRINFKTKNSLGVDTIKNRALKHKQQQKNYLNHIYSNCFKPSSFPQDWKNVLL